MATPDTNRSSSPSIASQLRRRLGTPKKNSTASTTPPVDGQKSLRGVLKAVAAVVPMVSVEVTAPLVIVTDGDESAQDAGSLAAVGVMAQVRFTVPANPPDGVTEITDVLPLVAPGLTERVLGLLLRAYALEVEVTVTLTTVVCVMEPEVPVTVTA
jgi:hypothetical protein